MQARAAEDLGPLVLPSPSKRELVAALAAALHFAGQALFDLLTAAWRADIDLADTGCTACTCAAPAAPTRASRPIDSC